MISIMFTDSRALCNPAPEEVALAWVMPVTFPQRHRLGLHGLLLDPDGCALISSGVSSLIPRGAVVAFVGCWNGKRTPLVDDARDLSEPDRRRSCRRFVLWPDQDREQGDRDGCRYGIAQTVRPRWRRLKKCRTMLRSRAGHEDQPRVAVPVGERKWFESIVNTTAASGSCCGPIAASAGVRRRVRLASRLLRPHELPVRRMITKRRCRPSSSEHRADLHVGRTSAEEMADAPGRERDQSEERGREHERTRSEQTAEQVIDEPAAASRPMLIATASATERSATLLSMGMYRR